MQSSVKVSMRVALCGGALLAWVAVSPASAGAGPQEAVDAQAGEYAGDDTCLICHDDQVYAETMHGRAANPRTPAAQLGCESCHGPGMAHADAGGDTDLIRRIETLSAAEVSETCTTCHDRGNHAFWEGSAHEARDLSCLSCHSVHTPKSEAVQLGRASVLETCRQCHRDKVNKLDRSGHMPVREGKMNCATCHNPHGSTNVRLLRVGNSINDACWSCHADKRGPFLWEHAPVRESCANCHDPHGSNNDRMLVAKNPFLCQRCHAHTRHPSTIYDGAVINSSNRLYARSCVTCHSNIHGSNHAGGTAFLR